MQFNNFPIKFSDRSLCLKAIISSNRMYIVIENVNRKIKPPRQFLYLKLIEFTSPDFLASPDRH